MIPDSYRWIFARIEAMQPDAGDPQQLIRFCERQKRLGYNGLMLWDSSLTRPQLSGDVIRTYSAFNEWCLRNGWRFGAQVFPQGEQLLWWPGTDAGMMEQSRGTKYLCLADPRVHGIYERIAENVLRLFPKGSALVALMAYYDEIRAQGTHARCRRPGGQLLAAHARRTMEIVRERAPYLHPAVWNDMFDPFHNGQTPYKGYPVYGGWRGSWVGIGPDVLVMNWMTPNRSTPESLCLQSFRWWAERGNPQIYCGFYDGGRGDGQEPDNEAKTLAKVKELPNVVGYCYTTWPPHNNLKRTGEYIAAARDGWSRPEPTEPTPAPAPVPPPQPEPAPEPPAPAPLTLEERVARLERRVEALEAR